MSKFIAFNSAICLNGLANKEIEENNSIIKNFIIYLASQRKQGPCPGFGQLCEYSSTSTKQCLQLLMNKNKLINMYLIMLEYNFKG